MDAQQAVTELFKFINGYQISQVIHFAASLGIADLLKDGLRPAAKATRTHASSMYRPLRALASAGVLEEQSDARFSLTEIGQCLRSVSRTHGSPGPVMSGARTSGGRVASCGTAWPLA